MPDLIFTNLLVLVCFLLSTVILTFYMSHKISGPLYQIEKVINSVSQGNLKLQVSLREGDQLKSVETKFNNMINSLNDRIRKIKNEVGEIKNLSQAPDGMQEETKEKIEKLDEMVCQLFDT